MVSCLMGDSTALASAIVRCCHKKVRLENSILILRSDHKFRHSIETDVAYEEHL